MHFAIADAGTLAYVAGPVGSAGDPRSLMWLGMTGQQERTPVPARPYNSISLSPDGTRAAVGIGEATSDVWVADLSRGGLIRLTTDAADDGGPLWNRNGDKVYFTSMRAGRPELYARAGDSTGNDERIAKFEETVTGVWARGWAPDGRLLVQLQRNGTNWDIGLVSIDGSDKLQLLLQSEASEIHPTVSPDGRWLAYTSNETGFNELYVRRFPELSGKRQLSGGAIGSHSTWSRSGNALVYLSSTRSGGGPDSIMRVLLDGTTEGASGKPERILAFPYFSQPSGSRFYDVSGHDDRLLVVSFPSLSSSLSGTLSENITVVINWTEQLKRRVPTN
jgi:Tol biopolymer transport system component